jgi:hypothetical protein
VSYEDGAGGAVYRLFDADGKLLYIGSTGDLRVRLQQHRLGVAGTSLADIIRRRYARHEVAFFPTLAAARRAELAAIATEQPELNIHGRTPLPTSSLWTAVQDAADERGVTMCEIAYRVDMEVRQLDRLLRNSRLGAPAFFGVAEVLGMKASELARRMEHLEEVPA